MYESEENPRASTVNQVSQHVDAINVATANIDTENDRGGTCAGNTERTADIHYIRWSIVTGARRPAADCVEAANPRSRARMASSRIEAPRRQVCPRVLDTTHTTSSSELVAERWRPGQVSGWNGYRRLRLRLRHFATHCPSIPGYLGELASMAEGAKIATPVSTLLGSRSARRSRESLWGESGIIAPVEPPGRVREPRLRLASWLDVPSDVQVGVESARCRG